MFLATWYQAGLLSVLGLLLIVVSAFALGWKTLADARSSDERELSRALLGALVAFVIFGQAQEVLFQRYGWVAVGLLVALRTGQLRSAARERPADARPAEPNLAGLLPAT